VRDRPGAGDDRRARGAVGPPGPLEGAAGGARRAAVSSRGGERSAPSSGAEAAVRSGPRHAGAARARGVGADDLRLGRPAGGGGRGPPPGQRPAVGGRGADPGAAARPAEAPLQEGVVRRSLVSIALAGALVASRAAGGAEDPSALPATARLPAALEVGFDQEL